MLRPRLLNLLEKMGDETGKRVLFRAAPGLRDYTDAQEALPTWSQLARFAAAFEPPKPGVAAPLGAGGGGGSSSSAVGGDGGAGAGAWSTAGARNRGGGGGGGRYRRGSSGAAEPVWPDEVHTYRCQVVPFYVEVCMCLDYCHTRFFCFANYHPFGLLARAPPAAIPALDFVHDAEQGRHIDILWCTFFVPFLYLFCTFFVPLLVYTYLCLC